jgi:hypothetical protein
MQGVREAVDHLSLEIEAKLAPLKASLCLDSPTATDSRYEILAQYAEYQTFGYPWEGTAPGKDFLHELSDRGLRKLRSSLDQGNITEPVRKAGAVRLLM